MLWWVTFWSMPVTTLLSPGLAAARTCPDLGIKRRWEREYTEYIILITSGKKSSDKAYLEILSMISCGAIFPGLGTTETFWLLSHVDQFCGCRFVSPSTPTKALFLGQPQWTFMIGSVFRWLSACFYSLIHHFLKQCFGISDSCTNPSCLPWSFWRSPQALSEPFPPPDMMGKKWNHIPCGYGTEISLLLTSPVPV